MNPEQPRTLRFGVMCRPEGLPAFAVQIIRSLTESKLAIPVLLIVDPEPFILSDLKTKIKKALRFQGNLWHLQSELFPIREIPAHKVSSLDSVLNGVPQVTCKVEYKGKYSQHFAVSDIDRIQHERLDFILKFAFGIIRGPILNAALHGVWSFHHDNEQRYRGGPPAFWEIQRGDPVTGALLQRLTERLDGGVVLKKCYVSTDSRSYRKNLNRILLASVHMPGAVCRDILNDEADYVSAAASKTTAPIFKAPNDVQMVQFYFQVIKGWLKYKIENHRCEMWDVGMVHQPITKFLDTEFKPTVRWSGFKHSSRYLADPFLVFQSGKTTVLCEQFDYCGERGWISEIEFFEDGKSSSPRTLIDEGIHMSYPYIFPYDGESYCCPESAPQAHVPLYRFNRNLGRWEKVARLLEGIDVVDATIFEHDGRWWLMHSLASERGAWGLHIWYASSPLGPWTAHPGNPVKIDVSGARPAGRPFAHEGALYRPAQDCSLSYGSALVIHRILKLSPIAFLEEQVRRIEPDKAGPYPDGLHTLNGVDGLSVIDSKVHFFPSFKVLSWRFQQKFKHRKPAV